MKLSTRTTHYKTSIALCVGLILVSVSPPFIPADADDLINDQSLGTVTVPESPRGITDANTPSQPQDALREQPENKRLNNDPAEYRPSQDLPVPVPNRALIAIVRSTSAKGLAAMRLVEKGRKLLKAGEQEKALSTLEKALGLEANPYVYFYLSQAHYQLGHYQAALNFLEAAESWLDQQSDWTQEITALKAQIPGSGVVQQRLGPITLVNGGN